jgi:4-alpha-glucanotransferase
MRIIFNIHYATTWGETLHVVGSPPCLGAWNEACAGDMHYIGAGRWSLAVDLPDVPVDLEYRYILRSSGSILSEEWPKNRRLSLSGAAANLYLMDYWQTIPDNLAYYSVAFAKIWFARMPQQGNPKPRPDGGDDIRIKVSAPAITGNQTLVMVGNRPELGNWDPTQALPMDDAGFPEWSCRIPRGEFHQTEYKFCIVNKTDKSAVHWETGGNRLLALPDMEEHAAAIVSCPPFRGEGFEWKCAGTVVPVFSLRSEHSFGIGDFADLKNFIDWLSLTSQKILQILPVNDTTLTHTQLDSYPYSAVSVYALHPLYLRLDELGRLEDSARRDFYRERQQILNALDTVDYEQVEAVKWAFFDEIFRQEGEKTLCCGEYIEFFRDNEEWLAPYAAYSQRRDKRKTPELYYYLQFHLHRQLLVARDYAHSKGIALKGDMPVGISRAGIEALTESQLFNLSCQAGAPPDDFSTTGQNWGFPTYNWAAMEAGRFGWWRRRFGKMTTYFDAYRIDHILGFFRIWEIPESAVQGLLGCFNPSLPLSVEEIRDAGFDFQPERHTKARIHEDFLPELFGGYVREAGKYLDRLSPRHFAPQAQFNTQLKIKTWFAGKEENEENRALRDGLYAVCNEVLFIEDSREAGYFHPRIAAASSFAYRELGADRQAFDRLYEDYFYRRHNDFWGEQGYRRLLSLIMSTDMLACGEDLGMIPACVSEVMRRLQILSLEIERMPKDPNMEFTSLRDLPHHSVCTTSTHDMATLRMWWEESPEKTQRYYNQVLHRQGAAPAECTADICMQILVNHLNTRAMLAIVPLQDLLSVDDGLRLTDAHKERINIPANPDHYWRYRMHLTIEDLMRADELNARLRGLIRDAGR